MQKFIKRILKDRISVIVLLISVVIIPLFLLLAYNINVRGIRQTFAQMPIEQVEHIEHLMALFDGHTVAQIGNIDVNLPNEFILGIPNVEVEHRDSVIMFRVISTEGLTPQDYQRYYYLVVDTFRALMIEQGYFSFDPRTGNDFYRALALRGAYVSRYGYHFANPVADFSIAQQETDLLNEFDSIFATWGIVAFVTAIFSASIALWRGLRAT